MVTFDEETEVPTLEATAFFALIAAGCVFWLWALSMAYSMGRDKEARLTIDAFERGDYAATELGYCVDNRAQIEHEVFVTDIYLWERIQALPQADR